MARGASEREVALSHVVADAGADLKMHVPFPLSMPPAALRTDEQWMEIVGGGRVPFRMSARIFIRELVFNLCLPFSIFFVKCFISNPDVFLWNRQMVFFGFYRALAYDSNATAKTDAPHTFFRRLLVFLAELARMLWILGPRSALMFGFVLVLYIQDLDEDGVSHPWVSYSYYPEITLIFVMMLIFTVFICLKWSFFPDSFDDLLKRERVPTSVLLNQQLMANWSPTLSQTLSSTTRAPLAVTDTSLTLIAMHSIRFRRNISDDIDSRKLQRRALHYPPRRCSVTNAFARNDLQPSEQPPPRALRAIVPPAKRCSSGFSSHSSRRAYDGGTPVAQLLLLPFCIINFAV
jgi:hypothetical protein